MDRMICLCNAYLCFFEGQIVFSSDIVYENYLRAIISVNFNDCENSLL